MRRLSWLAIASVLVACSSDQFSAADGGTDAGGDSAIGDGAVSDVAGGGPVAFRDKAIGAALATAFLKLSKPLTAVTGDLVIVFIGTDISTTITPPAGFTPVWEDTNGGCSPYKFDVYKGVVGASDGSEYVFSTSAPGDHQGALFLYANGALDKVQLVQSSSHTNMGALPVDALSNSPAGSMDFVGLISFSPIDQPPGNMIERASVSGGRGRGYDAALPNGGPLPARTITPVDATCASIIQLVLGKR